MTATSTERTDVTALTAATVPFPQEWLNKFLAGTDPAAAALVLYNCHNRVELSRFLVMCAAELDKPESVTEEDARIHTVAMAIALDLIPNGKDIKPHPSPLVLRLLASLINPPDKS